MAKDYIYGSTFDEMLHPEKINPEVRKAALSALKSDPLNPVNLFNITWKDEKNKARYLVLPKELTGVDANIIVMYGKEFPTGSHKVGATYSVAIEKQLFDEIVPGEHNLVWPSTGNYGIGGAWVGPRLGYDSLVLLPEMMSQERFDKISSYGAKFIKTPGCESNVKEIYDKTKELAAADKRNKILNQFQEMGNYRFHYYVTGNTIAELVKELQKEGVGNGRAAAFISSMGSSGTIAAGDRLKQEFRDSLIVGLEPIQCPTLYNNGYGGHDIQGIGDKHVTWIHNVMNMDAIICIDDIECKKALQAIHEPAGTEVLVKELGIPEAKAKFMSELFGISGICNIIGAIKTAKFYELGKNQNIVTIATDSMDRYYSVMKQMTETYGKMDKTEAKVRLVSIFHNAKTDWIKEGTVDNRKQWHNLKYFTWVE
ncbi:MAG: pyridoxal-phosphate dependent enzyme, partial [Firmicutes bacterium]|nr:pyridoxal-phosphate dependent enzyme [Bacillota bacterium]